MTLRSLLLLLSCLLAAPLAAEPGMVSAADPRGAAAGVEMLRAGGSATDAAIAMMLAQNVVEPQSSGIGGGGFLVHHDAKANRIDTYNGRETAPAAADPRWFYRPDGAPLGKGEAIPGGRSVGVPGNLRMMWAAHEAHGHLPWARLFQPAIRLARNGFTESPRLHEMLIDFTSYGGKFDVWAKATYLMPDGKPKPVGAVIRNPELAAFLAQVAAHGPDIFYVGPNAQAITATVDSAARNPSRMVPGDLASYSAQTLAPVCGMYRAYRICGMGPPSSGGVAVFAILKQLERFDMAKLGRDSPVAWHLLAESERLAYSDRDMYLADADHVAVPLAGLIDPAYLASRSALISPDRTTAEVAPGNPPGAPARQRVPSSEPAGTSHMVAVDRDGNVASVTSTIESPFGSGLTVNGYFLNNELTDFDFVPEKDGALVANRVEGGKRPRSSMSPTIVYGPDGHVRVAIGAAGGSTIIAQVAKALVAVLDWGMSAQDAIALGLVYAPGRVAFLEQGTQAAAMAPALTALGEPVRITQMGLKANAVEWAGGHWRGGADPRTEGVALHEDGRAEPIVRAHPKDTAPPE